MYKLKDVYKTFPSGATEDYKILRAFEMGKQEGGAKVKELEAQIEKMKCCGNCAKNGHICVAEEMQGKLCGKNKDKGELRR
jgi:hypothetical protein